MASVGRPKKDPRRPRGFLSNPDRPWLLPTAAILLLALLTVHWWRPLLTGPDETAHLAFRDEVIDVIQRRFTIGAFAVPNEPLTIEIGDKRRTLAKLFDVASRNPEPARRETIYQWFLGDPATAGRFVVRDDPLPADHPALPKAPVASSFPDVETKHVKTLRVRPDGSPLPQEKP